MGAEGVPTSFTPLLPVLGRPWRLVRLSRAVWVFITSLTGHTELSTENEPVYVVRRLLNSSWGRGRARPNGPHMARGPRFPTPGSWTSPCLKGAPPGQALLAGGQPDRADLAPPGPRPGHAPASLSQGFRSRCGWRSQTAHSPHVGPRWLPRKENGNYF